LRIAGTALGLSLAGCSTLLENSDSSSRTSPSTRAEEPLEECPTDEQTHGEWPTVGYDARNRGSVPEGGGPDGPIRELWRFPTGGWVESAPAVAGDTVYVSSRDRAVYALSAADGDEDWEFQTGISDTSSADTAASEEPMRSSPTVVDGTVYVGGGNFEVRHRDDRIERVADHTFLYALEADTGDLQWRFRTDDVIESAPTVVDGVAYVGCNSGTVYAVDVADGRERWRFSTAKSGGRGIQTTPAVADCAVYVGSWADERVYALDAQDGSVTWRYEASGPVSAAPAVGDGLVYVGVNGGGPLVALSTDDGSLEWEYETNGSVTGSSPAIADGTVYVGDQGESANRLHAVDATSGDERWSVSPRGFVWSSPAVADGTVYVGDFENRIYGYDTADGSERWQFETGDDVRSSPAVVDGTLYVGSDDGNLYALRDR
jgi:outer membrane protein assembly factor BamB